MRGAGALVVVLLLLLGASIAGVYLQRNVWLEQKTEGNLEAGTVAHEAAEAGIDWAIGMLNMSLPISEACLPGPGPAHRFRDLYGLPDSTTAHPLTRAAPVCHLHPAAIRCRCPLATQPPEQATDLARFHVNVAPSPASLSQVLELTATGCAPGSTPCTTASAAHTDAVARIVVLAQAHPLLPHWPAAALTCGQACQLGDGTRIENTDVSDQGLMIHAGGNVVLGPGTRLDGLPGSPPDQDVHAQDATLLALADVHGTTRGAPLDPLFSALTGRRLDTFAKAPLVYTVDCNTAMQCNERVAQAHAAGWRAIYFPNAVVLGSLALGTEDDPVVLVARNTLTLRAPFALHGLLVADQLLLDEGGSGAIALQGASVSRQTFVSPGHVALYVRHSSATLTALRHNTRVFVKRPGTWRDHP